MGAFSKENAGGHPAFTAETPGTPAGGFVDETALPTTAVAFQNITTADYFDLLGNQPATPFTFENVPGYVLQDFTGQQFGDDTYFTFGADSDFSLGYNTSDNQMVVISQTNEILFGVSKEGGLRLKTQSSVPQDTEINTDIAKVGTEFYLRKDDTGDTYNMS
jgi:hypothetical protein